MRSRTANWFETTVRYERQTEDGQKKVSELYVVDALTFGEAEETITKEMEPFATGEFEVKAISPAAYGEIFFSDSDTDDHWYKAKLSFIIIDEVSDMWQPDDDIKKIAYKVISDLDAVKIFIKEGNIEQE